ncbi:MAG: hypothetical protein QOK36_2213 [Gaiellales bacterium]|jgi:uncharacterized repeat protein (TIGR01451 family)|nr:hypothetical protein [Gaiellales bacterium]
MFTTRLAAALVAVAAISAIVLPGVASANSGSVKCDSTGIVFTYNTNFDHTTVVTETVNGATKLVTVPARTQTTDLWPLATVRASNTVGAVWSGGSIATVPLTCPVPPAAPQQPVAPPPAPPATPVVSTPTPPAPPVVTTSTPPAVVVSTTPAAATPPPVLSVIKKAGASTVAPDGTVKYSLLVTSKGGTAHGVVVCDKLPAHMTYVANKLGNATMQNGKACWTLGDLDKSITLSLTAKVDADAPAGSLTNNVTATSENAGRATSKATINVPARHGVKGKLSKRTPRKGVAGVTG